MIQTVFGFDFGLNIQMKHQSLILLSLSFSSINKKDRPHTHRCKEIMASGIICYRKQLSSITQVKFLNWKYRVDAKVRHQWRISIQRFTNQHENFRLFSCFLCIFFSSCCYLPLNTRCDCIQWFLFVLNAKYRFSWDDFAGVIFSSVWSLLFGLLLIVCMRAFSHNVLFCCSFFRCSLNRSSVRSYCYSENSS